MDTNQLVEVLLNDAHTRELYSGVFAADTIPRGMHFPTIFIANTDPKTKAGSHWVAFYVNSEGECEYFDSMGRPPLIAQHRHFLERQCRSWTCNSTTVQSSLSDTCGQHCVVYLAIKARGFSLSDYLNLFVESPSLMDNDVLIRKIFEKHFVSCAHTERGEQCCSPPRVE